MGQRSFMSLLDLQLPDTQSRLACKVRALSVVIIYKFVDYFIFVFVGKCILGQVPVPRFPYKLLRT